MWGNIVMNIVLIITRSDIVGGAQVHVRDLSLELINYGHTVEVLIGGAGTFADGLAEKGVPYHSLLFLDRPIRPYRDLRACVELYQYLRVRKPHLIATHSSKAGWLGRIIGRLLGIPTVFTVHGWSFTDGVPLLHRVLYSLAELVLSPISPAIITVSEYDRLLGARIGVGNGDGFMVTVHNGVPDIPVALRSTSSSDCPRLIMVARFDRQKDHLSLLKALHPLMGVPWVLDLVGDGPLKREIMSEAVTMGMEHRVNFLGTRKDVADLLSKADIFVLTSHWEGLPLSILEGMRACLPIVASDVGGISEAVRDSENGYLIPKNELSVSVLTRRLQDLIQNSDLRLEMGNKSRTYYETGFTLERMVTQTIGVYENLLSRVAVR